MEVLEGLHRIETRLGNRKLFHHIFVGDRVILIDTGLKTSPAQDIFPYLESIGRRPTDIDVALISHADADHFGGNEAIKTASPRTLLAAHTFDAPWASDPDVIMEARYNQFAATHGMEYPQEVKTFLRDMMGGPAPIDLHLRGGETILLSGGRPLRILFLPGHTRGHIGVYDPANRAAVLTDAVLWRGLPDDEGGIAMPPTYCHTETYRTTIQAVERLNLETLFLSHYEAVSGAEAVADFLAETRRFVERADQVVLDGLREANGWQSLKDLIAHADPVLGPFGDTKDELAYPLLGHLREFTAHGRLEEKIIEGITHWRLKLRG